MKENYIKKMYSKRISSNFDAVKTENSTKSTKNIVNFSQELTNTQKTFEDETEIIDLSLAEPDSMPDFFIIDTLCKEASKWENRGVQNSAEKMFNESAANYLCNFLGAQNIDGNEELCAIGSVNDGLLSLALAFINSGDLAAVNNLQAERAQVFSTAVRWCGGTALELSQKQKGKFPKYEDISQKSLKKLKIIYINYPSELTGQTATLDFFKETLDFARVNNLLVVNDASLLPLSYNPEKRLSLLSVDGAKKLAAELHGFKYGFNMTGWQTGFLAGNKAVVKAVSEIDKKRGRILYQPALCAAAYALSREDIPLALSKKYERRANLIIKKLESLGFKIKKPKAGCYLYVKAPKSVNGQKLSDSSELQRIFLSRGVKVSAHSDLFIRFSLMWRAFDGEEEHTLANALYERLKPLELEF